MEISLKPQLAERILMGHAQRIARLLTPRGKGGGGVVASARAISVSSQGATT